MAVFRCPFCKQIMSINQSTRRTEYTNFTKNLSSSYMELTIYRCPNCFEETLIAKGINGYLDGKKIFIYPDAMYMHFPDYVPSSIYEDYKEACFIKEKSPKAAATLARRCLQGMIRDYWNITEQSSLYQEIDSIKDHISPVQWRVIDAVRNYGNIGAHMEQDVNTMIDVEPEEAEMLIQLIELLVDKWYVARHDEEELYSEIISSASANV